MLSEDNVSGKITDEMFSKMSAKYEAEQVELAERIKALKAELAKETDKTMSTDMFIATVRKYTRAKKLTQRMLNELVDYIEVYRCPFCCVSDLYFAHHSGVDSRQAGRSQFLAEKLYCKLTTIHTRRLVTAAFFIFGRRAAYGDNIPPALQNKPIHDCAADHAGSA